MNRYQIEHCDGLTIIRAQGCDPQLPTFMAGVVPDGDYCMIHIYIGGVLAAKTTIQRGKAFAIRVARFMLKGFLSGLGRHRRATKNRAKRVAGETLALPVKGVAI